MAKMHALNAPSGASRWVPCPGSTALAKGIPDRSNASSEEGTCAHEFAAMGLVEGKNAADYIGRASEDAPGWVFTEDMAPFVQQYLDYINGFAAAPTCISASVEEAVDMTAVVPGCFGTSDCILVSEVPGLVCPTDPTLPHLELRVVDLKFGRGIKVFAEGNEQAMLYALGALLKLREQGMRDPDSVVLVIHQPRLDHVDEWTTDVGTIERFAKAAAESASIAQKAWDGKLDPRDYLVAGPDQCTFCRAKAICPEQARMVEATTMLHFDDLDAKPAVAEASAPGAEPVPVPGPGRERPLHYVPSLAQQMDRVGMVEDWCKAVRAAAEAALLAGQKVGDWKLVQGRQGPRKWTDADAAEQMLRTQFRLKTEHAYDLTLISPTTAEKHVKAGLIGERQWAKLQALIGRAEPGLSVAPGSDPRPAVVLTAPPEAFDDLDDAEPTAPDAAASPASTTNDIAELDGAELI